MNMIIKADQATVINCLNSSAKGTIANKKYANSILKGLIKGAKTNVK